VSSSTQVQVRRLLDEALADAGGDVPTSTILDKAIRIARLQRDGRNLIWLTMEARTLGDEASKLRVVAEVRPFFSSYEELKKVWSAYTEEVIDERSIVPRRHRDDDRDEMLAMSVREMEAQVESLGEMAEDARRTEGLGRAEVVTLADSRAELILRRSQIKAILARVRTRIHDYLTTVEQELAVDAAVTSAFEALREYVDARLRDVAPLAFAQLASAQQRRNDKDPEARSQALSSCRRALKSVADATYPPTSTPKIGADGREHQLTDDRYIARLLQFVYEKRKGKASAELLRAQVDALAGRLEALNDLSSKGVHAEVSAEEVDQTILETYLVIGEILRLGDEQSRA
jgi:hypothetical protein